MNTWRPEDDGTDIKLTGGTLLRAGLRAIPLSILVFGGLFILLVCRLPESLLYARRRPLTPFISSFVCRNALRLMGVQYETHGRPMTQDGALVANHSSWLDIFALNARDQVYFVSKSEVARWPGIGWLARATGTVFIARDPRQAAAQKLVFESRLRRGDRLVFFPEGTSTDGLRVLPFKSTLFAAFFDDGLHEDVSVQPVTVRYAAPIGEEDRFYGWWGDMDFAPHFLRILGARQQGKINVTYHAPLRVRDFPTRKDLAKACEDAVRSGFEPLKDPQPGL